MRKRTMRAMTTGILAAGAYAAWRGWRARVPATTHDTTWDSAPFPFPPVPRPAREAIGQLEPWTDPDADGACPATHPVKAKLASGIYHLPGGSNYERTKPDRCYVDAAAAEADGLRAANS